MYIEVYTYNTINLNIPYKNETKNLVGTDVEKKKGKKGREKNINIIIILIIIVVVIINIIIKRKSPLK